LTNSQSAQNQLPTDQEGDEIIEACIWRLHSAGRDAASIAAAVNQNFGQGRTIVTAELVSARIARFSALRKAQPQTSSLAVARLVAGCTMLRGQLALALPEFRDDDPRQQRMGAVSALQAVCDFVEGFADAPDGPLTRPLRGLMAALADLDTPAVHPMLAPAQTVTHRPRMPHGRSRMICCAVGAMEAAMAEGIKRTDAGRMVAQELHKRGYRLTEGGKPIEGSTVMQWRAEAMRGPGGAHDLAAEYLSTNGPRIRREACELPKGSWKRELAFLDEFGLDIGLRKNPPC
jgi:hypothetical protein